MAGRTQIESLVGTRLARRWSSTVLLVCQAVYPRAAIWCRSQEPGTVVVARGTDCAHHARHPDQRKHGSVFVAPQTNERPTFRHVGIERIRGQGRRAPHHLLDPNPRTVLVHPACQTIATLIAVYGAPNLRRTTAGSSCGWAAPTTRLIKQQPRRWPSRSDPIRRPRLLTSHRRIKTARHRRPTQTFRHLAQCRPLGFRSRCRLIRK